VADPDSNRDTSPSLKEKASELDLTLQEPAEYSQNVSTVPAIDVEAREVFNEIETRENTRGDLARGLLWLLTLVVGGVLVFIGLGRLDGTVLTQSIFPSLVALAGTALGFYFGSQTAKGSDTATGTSPNGNGASTGGAASGNTSSTGQQKTGG
jgi:hypothetical protein